MARSDCVTCPHCNARITDLSEAFNCSDTSETMTIECGECDKEVRIRRCVSVEYVVLETKETAPQ